MEKLRCEIRELKQETEKLIIEKDREFIEYFNDAYGAGFADNREFNDFTNLFDEDEEGYFDPFDLIMDENDIARFMQWRYRLFIIANMQSIADGLEQIERGNSHTAIKKIQQDVSDLRKYKKCINQIIDISNDALGKIDKLMKTADEYRK